MHQQSTTGRWGACHRPYMNLATGCRIHQEITDIFVNYNARVYSMAMFEMAMIATIVLVQIGLLVTMNLGVAQTHPHEVYIVWYVFSLFFVLILGLEVLAFQNSTTLLSVCGPYENTCKTIYDLMTDVGHELAFLGFLAAIIVLPQILAWFLSGLFGAASAPIFIRALLQFSSWSIVKFAACLAGIKFAHSVAAWTLHFNYSTPGFKDDLFSGLLILTVAFSYASVATTPSFFRIESIPPLYRLHLFFTRRHR